MLSGHWGRDQGLLRTPLLTAVPRDNLVCIHSEYFTMWPPSQGALGPHLSHHSHPTHEPCTSPAQDCQEPAEAFNTCSSSVVSYDKKLHFPHLAFPLGSLRVQLSSSTAIQNLQSRQKTLLICHKLSPPPTSSSLQTLDFRGCPLLIPTPGPSAGVLNCSKLIPVSGYLMAHWAKDLLG